MIEFKQLALSDKYWMDELLKSENSRSSDHNFGSMYMWLLKYPLYVARFENRLLIRNNDAVPCYSFPLGSGSVRPALEALMDHAAKFGGEFCLNCLTQEQRQTLEHEYPNSFEFSEKRCFADYMYPAEKLATYSGHSLHGKRNHCNRFEAEHEWQFVPITRELIPSCRDMLRKWSEDNLLKLDGSAKDECVGVERCLDAYEELELEGGVLIADGNIMGFSIGEMACDDTFDVHIEKALSELDGTYAMVCREMTRMAMKNHPKLRYMNREEDLDIEYLRSAKMLYKPEYLLTKYNARWKNGYTGIS